MTKIGFLIGLFILAVTAALAQETINKGDIIIHIRTTSSTGYGSNFIDIYKRDAIAEIIYAKFDSIAYAKVRKDTAYINKRIDPDHIDPQKSGQLGPIFDRHSVYDTTKVIVKLKTDTAYNKILQLLTQSTKQELETSKIGEHAILDGFGFSCEIIISSGIKTFSNC